MRSAEQKSLRPSKPLVRSLYPPTPSSEWLQVVHAIPSGRESLAQCAAKSHPFPPAPESLCFRGAAAQCRSGHSTCCQKQVRCRTATCLESGCTLRNKDEKSWEASLRQR